MRELFDSLVCAKYFTKMDLRSRYHQIRIAEGDVEKTTMRTRYGSIDWLVLCFGLTNAPAKFNTLMNLDFHDLLDVCVVLYLDDILIYARMLAEHVAHLRTVLTKLRENQLYLKKSKCNFSIFLRIQGQQWQANDG